MSANESESPGGFVIHFGDGQLVDLTEQDDYAFPHPLQRWVLPVLPMHQEPVASGSAFLVAPGIAITARHVVEDSTTTDDPSLIAVFVSGESIQGYEGPWGGPLAVRQVILNTEHDLAIVTLEWGEIDGAPFRCAAAPLTTRVPEVGETVFSVGYTNVSAELSDTTIELAQKVVATRGVIVETFPDGRDFLINYPVIMGGFPAPGGLSGGPVVDERGNVFAVVSRSMEPFEEVTEWTSYASLIGPVLDMPFSVNLDGVLGEHTLRALALAGVVAHDGSFV